MRLAYLIRLNCDKNMARFYQIHVTEGLFEWGLVREWGRIGSGGAMRTAWFLTEQDALSAGQDLMGKKLKKGYRAISI